MALNERAKENFIQKRRKEARDEADFQWLDPISEEERLSGKILTFIRHELYMELRYMEPAL